MSLVRATWPGLSTKEYWRRIPKSSCACPSILDSPGRKQAICVYVIGCMTLRTHPHQRGTLAMITTFSCSQARRRIRRLFALVARGHSFVITKNGREICRLVYAEAKE